MKEACSVRTFSIVFSGLHRHVKGVANAQYVNIYYFFGFRAHAYGHLTAVFPIITTIVISLSALLGKLKTKVKEKLKRRTRNKQQIEPAQPSNLPALRDIHLRIVEDARMKDFTVSDRILTKSSKFFQRGLCNHWKEAVEGRVLLPEIDVSAFEAIPKIHTSPVSKN